MCPASPHGPPEGGHYVLLERGLVLLFSGGTKKRQQVDIARALALHEEYKARKKAASQVRPPGARGKR